MFTSSVNRSRHGAPKKIVEREQRVQMAKTASICVDGADMAMPCTVRDLHSQGARISIANVSAVPDRILLIIRSENMVSHASVAWRKASEIGVRFIRTGELHLEDQFRREQAMIHKKAQEAIARMEQDKERARQRLQAQADMQEQQEAHERKRKMHIMGIDPRFPFGEDDLKRAYRKQAMIKHPDQGGSMEAFQELNLIYQALLATVVAPVVQQEAIAI